LAPNSTECTYAIFRSLHESTYAAMLWSGAEMEDVYPNIFNHSAVIGKYYSNTTAYCVSSYFNWVLYFDLRAA